MIWMTPEVIVSIATLFTAIIGFATIMVQNSRQHALTNSRMDELLVQTSLASEAKGNLAGREEAREIDARIESEPKTIIAEIEGKVIAVGEPTKGITGQVEGEVHPLKPKEATEKANRRVNEKAKAKRDR